MIAQYEDFQKFGRQGMDTALKSFETISGSFQAMATAMADLSRKQFDLGSAAFERFVAVKTLDKAVEVQAEFVKQSFEGLVAHSTTIGRLVTDLAKEAVKPAAAAKAGVAPAVGKAAK